jgi:hypothetical protein
VIKLTRINSRRIKARAAKIVEEARTKMNPKSAN